MAPAAVRTSNTVLQAPQAACRSGNTDLRKLHLQKGGSFHSRGRLSGQV